MRSVQWMPMLLLIFCSACSPIVIEEAENVRLDYWEKEASKEKMEQEYLDENTGLDIFVDAVNDAEELEGQNIITTRPLLSMEFMMESQDNRIYHLWVTENGAGYLQSLMPHKSVTYRMDTDSVEVLKNFLATKDHVTVIQGEIEFEQQP